ncbi:MAG TPA: hypothetical protein VFP59_14160 [Candidatus Angelobacter sp.]|nr:hypothetical protein [Candidatus Angelobacter sp.]
MVRGRLSLKSQPANAFVFTVLLCLIALSAGCVISPRRIVGVGSPTPTPNPGSPSPTPTPVPGAPGKLYVADSNNNSILRFDNANTADGNLAPAATISGALTLLNSPHHIFVDSNSDTLYVANQGNVLAFDGVSTKSANAAPRSISGNLTGLTAPVDVGVDSSKNLLYVADGRDVFVFANASTVTGNTAFEHDIHAGFVISALFVDSANDRLYLADAATNTIDVYDGASGLNLTVPPTRTISGTATQLNQPSGIAIDALGKLIISNKGTTSTNSSITIYVNAAGAQGNIPPQVTITGAGTTLNAAGQIAVNNSSTLVELFVANVAGGNVPIFSDLGAKSGNVSPSRNINGSATGLSASGIGGITLDSNR